MILNAREVPATDHLATVLSVELPNGKYRHYQVPLAYTIAVTESSSKAYELAINMIRERVKKDFGPDTEISVFQDLRPANQQEEGIRAMVDLPTGWFNPEVIAALQKRQSKNLLYQYHRNMTRFSDGFAQLLDTLHWKLLETPISYINRGIGKINRLLQKVYGIDKMWDAVTAELDNDFKVSHDDWEHTSEYHELLKKYEAAAEGKFFIPFIPQHQGNFRREVTQAVYLARICGQEQLDETIEALSEDLNQMQALGLIFGHLAMPRMTELQNTVGNGKKVYGVFAFPLVDSNQLMYLTGAKSYADLPQGWNTTKALQEFGIGSAVNEGGIAGEYPYKNELESSVLVGEEEIQARRDADNNEVTKAYLEQKEATKRLMERKIQQARNITKKD